MNTTDGYLTGLLTDNVEIDGKLRIAYELGFRQGRATDRDNLKRSAEIEATKRLLAALMRAQHLDLNAAMVTLAIPRKERKTYTKIFAEKARQKQARSTKSFSHL